LHTTRPPGAGPYALAKIPNKDQFFMPESSASTFSKKAAVRLSRRVTHIKGNGLSYGDNLKLAEMIAPAR
jgi:hypothetical protein